MKSRGLGDVYKRQVLTVRKESSTKFQLPGGKMEIRETPVQAAAREVAEEIGVDVRLPELSLLGTFDAPAANEPGETVRGQIFTYPRPVLARAAAEIAEIAWVDPTNPDRELAHLLRDKVFPALRS